MLAEMLDRGLASITPRNANFGDVPVLVEGLHGFL